ncbi:hypothetical protein BHE74_00044731, partial [Ensete ventricosum]
MAWWDRVASPMRRVWAGVATRVGIRKSGESDPLPTAARGGSEHVRVRGRARVVGTADGVGAGGAAPADGGDEGDETPGRGVARFGAGPLRLLPQALDSSHACRHCDSLWFGVVSNGDSKSYVWVDPQVKAMNDDGTEEARSG